MNNRRSKKEDAAARKLVADYASRYAMNRPIGSSEKPNLCVAILSGTGREVYNRDGGETIATFATQEAAQRAVREFGY